MEEENTSTLETETEEESIYAKEHNNYAEAMTKLKLLDLKEFAPPKWLENAETPFHWSQTLNRPLLFRGDAELKYEDYYNQENFYSMEKFSVLLTLIFTKVLMNDLEETKYYLSEMERILSKMATDERDKVYARVGPALQNMYSATKAYLMSNLDCASAEKEAYQFVPLSQMSHQCQAGVYAVKARYYLSCYSDTSPALDSMLLATKLDPEFAPWLYWTGKILRKVRRENKEKEPTEEIPYLKSAVDRDRDPKHLVYLAQAYREKAKFLFKAHSQDPDFSTSDFFKQVVKLNRKSADLYRECWTKCQDSAALCRRLGNGLMNLPRHYADYPLARQVLHHAEKISSNPVTYHMLGTFYYRYQNDLEKAREYFQKGMDYGLIYGYNEVIRLKYLKDKDYDPYEDLKKEEEAMEFSVNLYLVHCDLGWYFLYFKKDLIEALKYFWKVIEQDEESVHLTRFSCYCFFVSEHVNMYSVLKREVDQYLAAAEGKDVDEIVAQFLGKISSRPELVLMGNVDTTLADMKRKVALSLKASRRKANLNCSEFMKNDGFVSKRYPGESYDDYRKAKLDEIVNLLKEQNINTGTNKEPEARKQYVIKAEVTNWREEKRNAPQGSTNVKSSCKPVPAMKADKVTNKWRSECNGFLPEWYKK